MSSYLAKLARENAGPGEARTKDNSADEKLKKATEGSRDDAEHAYLLGGIQGWLDPTLYSVVVHVHLDQRPNAGEGKKENSITPSSALVA